MQLAAPASPADYYAIRKACSVCLAQSDNIVLFPILVNGSGNCSLGENFNYGGILYKLPVRPDLPDGTFFVGPYVFYCNRIAAGGA